MVWSLAVVAILVPALIFAQERVLSPRFGFEFNPNFYPQKTPQETLESITKAIDNKRIDYMLAHLADPLFVDQAVTDYQNAIPKGSDKAKLFLAFDRLMAETTQYLVEDPTVLRELRRFAKDAEWDTKEDVAVGTLKTLQGRKVFLRKYEERWFLENKQM